MGFAFLSRPEDGHPLSVWSRLADIEEVEGALGPRDRAFLRQVGRVLADHGAAGRFGITLLHSHFPVARDEALVEGVGEDGKLITQVMPLDIAEGDAAIVPRCWMFADDCATDGREELSVLTWSRRDHLPQKPLSSEDHGLIAELARLFRARGMTGRFGMALCGPAPGTGRIWTEDNDAFGRHLIQIPQPVEEVARRHPITTLYAFAAEGGIIGLGCCCAHPAAGQSGITGYKWGRRC